MAHGKVLKTTILGKNSAIRSIYRHKLPSCIFNDLCPKSMESITYKRTIQPFLSLVVDAYSRHSCWLVLNLIPSNSFNSFNVELLSKC